MERRAGDAAAHRRARGLRPADHPAAEWTGQAIIRKDLAGLDWTDTVVAIMDGADPDSGTCWECGYAYARGKTVVLFRSDMRGSGDERDIPHTASRPPMSPSGATEGRLLPLGRMPTTRRAAEML